MKRCIRCNRVLLFCRKGTSNDKYCYDCEIKEHRIKLKKEEARRLEQEKREEARRLEQDKKEAKRKLAEERNNFANDVLHTIRVKGEEQLSHLSHEIDEMFEMLNTQRTCEVNIKPIEDAYNEWALSMLKLRSIAILKLKIHEYVGEETVKVVSKEVDMIVASTSQYELKQAFELMPDREVVNRITESYRIFWGEQDYDRFESGTRKEGVFYYNEYLSFADSHVFLIDTWGCIDYEYPDPFYYDKCYDKNTEAFTFPAHCNIINQQERHTRKVMEEFESLSFFSDYYKRVLTEEAQMITGKRGKIWELKLIYPCHDQPRNSIKEMYGLRRGCWVFPLEWNEYCDKSIMLMMQRRKEQKIVAINSQIDSLKHKYETETFVNGVTTKANQIIAEIDDEKRKLESLEQCKIVQK